MKFSDSLQFPKTSFARGRLILLLGGVCFVAGAPAAQAAVQASAQGSIDQGGAQQGNIQQGAAQQGSIQQGSAQQGSAQRTASPEKTGVSLESAAAKAGNTARTVAMSLIGLALAIASIVLAFRRDFKEAAGVFAVGIVAVLLATPAGLSLLQDTVTSLFGA
jgi:hypothetical protein